MTMVDSTMKQFWLDHKDGVSIPEASGLRHHGMQRIHTWGTVLDAVALDHCALSDGTHVTDCWAEDCDGYIHFTTTNMQETTLITGDLTHRFACDSCGERGQMIDLIVAVGGMTDRDELARFFDELPCPIAPAKPFRMRREMADESGN